MHLPLRPADSGVDECALGIDICHKTRAECVDLPSGYMCLCLAGYKGNGKTCEGNILQRAFERIINKTVTCRQNTL